MPFTTLTNQHVRQKQYIHALNYYIQNTEYPIVFTENSGIDISQYFKTYIINRRLEVLTFCGNSKKDRGKGYGEAEIIEYALTHSSLITEINNTLYIIKITGRLIVDNLFEIINNHFPLENEDCIRVSYDSMFSFADSRIIIAPLLFYKTFLNLKEDINDYKNSFFEVVLTISPFIMSHRFLGNLALLAKNTFLIPIPFQGVLHI